MKNAKLRTVQAPPNEMGVQRIRAWVSPEGEVLKYLPRRAKYPCLPNPGGLTKAWGTWTPSDGVAFSAIEAPTPYGRYHWCDWDLNKCEYFPWGQWEGGYQVHSASGLTLESELNRVTGEFRTCADTLFNVALPENPFKLTKATLRAWHTEAGDVTACRARREHVEVTLSGETVAVSWRPFSRDARIERWQRFSEESWDIPREKKDALKGAIDRLATAFPHAFTAPNDWTKYIIANQA